MPKPQYFIVEAAQVCCPPGGPVRASTSIEVLSPVVEQVQSARRGLGNYLPLQDDETTLHRSRGGQEGAYRYHCARKAINELHAAWQREFACKGDPTLGYASHANLTLEERASVLSLGAAIDAMHDWIAQNPFNDRVPDLPARLWHEFRDNADAFLECCRGAAAREGTNDEPDPESDISKGTIHPGDHRIMTEGQKRLWQALFGRALTAKKLAAKNELDTSEDTVRQWKRELTTAGYDIEHRRGRGYYRPDAPPNDLRNSDSA